MKTTQIKRMLALAFGILSTAVAAQAQFITPNPNLPPIGGVYSSSDIFAIYGGPALQFILSVPQHTVVAPDFNQNQGPDEIEHFFSTLDANLEVKQNGITVQNGPIQANGLDTIITFGKVGNTTGTFNTEMLSLNLSGGTLPPGVMFRESPTLASLGQTSITDIGGGLYRIDSFFDVFTELSIDGGQTWMPQTSPPGHIALGGVPEPTTVSLLAVGLFSAIGFMRRRR